MFFVILIAFSCGLNLFFRYSNDACQVSVEIEKKIPNKTIALIYESKPERSKKKVGELSQQYTFIILPRYIILIRNLTTYNWHKLSVIIPTNVACEFM